MLLYRFVDLGAFIDIVANGQMYLRQVMAWDDPYETDAVTHLMSNLLEKTDLAILDRSPAASAKVIQLREAMGKAILEQETKFIYAQSWTEKPESDALWRIYSPDRKGVRLSVELDILLNKMAKTLPNVDHFKVEYCSREEARTRLLARFNERKSMDLTSCCRYCDFDTDSARTFFALANFKFHFVTLARRLSLNFRYMEKQITAAIASDEAKTLFSIKKLYRACIHYNNLSIEISSMLSYFAINPYRLYP